MTANLQVFETIFAFLLVILLCLLLRKVSIIKEEDGKTFSGLLLKAVLPAVIFLQLSSTSIRETQFLLVLAVIITGILSMTLAWLVGRAMRLSRAKTGALMLTSSFGSSSLIGYPFIAFSFPNNPEALADAVLLSELGVALPLFILGPAVGLLFGDSYGKGEKRKALNWSYFTSPIFVAVVLGIAVSFLPFNRNHAYIAPFFEALKMINGAMTILACLILALQLKMVSLKGLLPLLLISAIIQMGFQPFMAHMQASLYQLSVTQTSVLVLISSLPSAVMGPVFAKQYECAPDTASALVMGHIFLSIAIVPSVFFLMS